MARLTDEEIARIFEAFGLATDHERSALLSQLGAAAAPDISDGDTDTLVVPILTNETGESPAPAQDG